jgi:type IV pilus assembly protein PilC
MEFKYSASTAEGSLINGVVEADSEVVAEEILWRSGLTVLNLKKGVQMPPLHEMLPSVFGVKRRDVIQFSRNLASLLDAGIPILRALTIQGRFGRRSFRAVLHDVIKDLEKGTRLSDACAKYPAIFPAFYIYLLKTGEEVGNLSQVLKDVSSYMEKDEATKSKVKKSMAYPSFVIVLAIGAIIVMLTFVVPALTSMYKEFGSDLPFMTRALIAVGDFFSANFFYMVGGIALLGIASVAYSKTPRGRRYKDAIILKIPIIGGAVLKGNLARFTRNIGMLVGAGVTLFEALKLTSETTDNIIIGEAIGNVRTKVNDGRLFSQALASEHIFPDLMAEMVGVGEESGSLEGHLMKVSGFYEEEAERAIGQVTSTLTPALTLGVGFIIGLIAVTIFTSIYSLVDVLPE